MCVYMHVHMDIQTTHIYINRYIHVSSIYIYIYIHTSFANSGPLWSFMSFMVRLGARLEVSGFQHGAQARSVMGPPEV